MMFPTLARSQEAWRPAAAAAARTAEKGGPGRASALQEDEELLLVRLQPDLRKCREGKDGRHPECTKLRGMPHSMYGKKRLLQMNKL